MQMQRRIAVEYQNLLRQPPPGISLYPVISHSKRTEHFIVSVAGPAGSVYQGGVFYIGGMFPERYPFEPPHIKFITRIHHPNIDAQGRICLSTLSMPPKGSWTPSLSLAAVLISIQQLVAEPNPSDPLVDDVAREMYAQRDVFEQRARDETREHATSEQKGVWDGLDVQDIALSSDANTPQQQQQQLQKQNRESEESSSSAEYYTTDEEEDHGKPQPQQKSKQPAGAAAEPEPAEPASKRPKH